MMIKTIISVFSCVAIAALLTACEEAPASKTEKAPPAIENTQWQGGAPETDGEVGLSHRITCDQVTQTLPSIEPVLKGLSQAAAARDATYISNMIYPSIRFGFDGSYGKENFLRHWSLDDPESVSDFWMVLEEMLNLGGYASFDAEGAIESVIFPCTFQALPENNWLRRRKPDISPYDYVMVVRDGTPIRDFEGKELRKLQFGEVLYSPEDTHEIMHAHDGIRGFVRPDDVRSPIDFRMYLQQDTSGQWKITLFIEGD